MLITEHGTKGMHMAAKVLDRIDDVLDDPSNPGRPEKLAITGQLSAFEDIPERTRLRIIDALQSDDLFARPIPWTFARVLMKCPTFPVCGYSTAGRVTSR